jgi:hypothetical protein
MVQFFTGIFFSEKMKPPFLKFIDVLLFSTYVRESFSCLKRKCFLLFRDFAGDGDAILGHGRVAHNRAAHGSRGRGRRWSPTCTCDTLGKKLTKYQILLNVCVVFKVLLYLYEFATPGIRNCG